MSTTPPDLSSHLGEAMAAVGFPETESQARETASALHQVADEMRRRIEASAGSAEVSVSLDALAGLRLAANVLECTKRQQPDERALSSAPPRSIDRVLGDISRVPIRGIALLAARCLLAAGIILILFFSTGHPFFAGVLFVAYLALDLVPIRDSPDSTLPGPSSALGTNAPIVDVATLRTHISNAMLSFATIASRYAQALQQVREAKQRQTAPDAMATTPIRTLQALLGAARLGHAQLPELVESQALAELENVGLTAVSYDPEAGPGALFDVQRDTEGHVLAPVELYPAIVSAHENRLETRGRVVVPRNTSRSE